MIPVEEWTNVRTLQYTRARPEVYFEVLSNLSYDCMALDFCSSSNRTS
jgi:hypothetical protein